MCVLGGGVSVLALLTSRRNTLPAPSMSAHTPLPCRLDLTVGGDDGENLGSRRGVDPEESERQRKADRSSEAYLQPTGRSSDSPSWYGSLKSPCLGFFVGWVGGGWYDMWKDSYINCLLLFYIIIFALLNKIITSLSYCKWIFLTKWHCVDFDVDSAISSHYYQNLHLKTQQIFDSNIFVKPTKYVDVKQMCKWNRCKNGLYKYVQW